MGVLQREPSPKVKVVVPAIELPKASNLEDVMNLFKQTESQTTATPQLDTRDIFADVIPLELNEKTEQTERSSSDDFGHFEEAQTDHLPDTLNQLVSLPSVDQSQSNTDRSWAQNASEVGIQG